MDLLDFFNGRYTPRKLGVLIDGLPRDSHLEQAKSLDIELARVFEGRPAVKQRKPPLAEFTREQELLVAIYSQLGNLLQATVSATGSKKKIKFKPWPTPESATNLLEHEHARAAREHVDSMLRYPDGRKVIS